MKRVMLPLVLVLWVSLANAQTFYGGECPDIPGPENFDFDRFLGKWYEQQRSFFALKLFGLCWSVEYVKANSKYNAVYGFRTLFPRRQVTLDGDITHRPNSTDPSKMVYSIFDPVVKENFQIIGTDYDNWAVEWSCSGQGILGHTETLTIYGREAVLDEVYLMEARNLTASRGLDVRSLRSTNTLCASRKKRPTTLAPGEEDIFAFLTSSPKSVASSPSPVTSDEIAQIDDSENAIDLGSDLDKDTKNFENL